MRRTDRRLLRGSVSLALLLAGSLLIGAETSPPGAAAEAGPTAVAEVRPLTATITADGVVESAGSSSVIRGRTSVVPAEIAEPAATGQASTEKGPAPTLTAMAGLGSKVTTGTVVYAADAEPVVAVVGSTPSWRTLEDGADDGPDVETLEKALVKLGYGDELTVDDEFTGATADAVTEWEEDLGRADPDGAVDPAEIVLIAADSQVVDHALEVGDAVPDDAAVLTLGSASRVVRATVSAEAIDSWPGDAKVTFRWSDGSASAGRVAAVGRDITPPPDAKSSGTTEVTFAADRIKQRTGTPVLVELVRDARAETLTVPVSALFTGADGKPAVTIAGAGADSARTVELGLIADGFAEITGGLDAGTRVRLP